MPNAIRQALIPGSLTVRCGAVFLGAMLLFDAAPVSILREIGSFLIVEDSLRPAAAIVALGGQTPFREIQAAKNYHSGLAPLVFVVREAADAEASALQALSIEKPQPGFPKAKPSERSKNCRRLYRA